MVDWHASLKIEFQSGESQYTTGHLEDSWVSGILWKADMASSTVRIFSRFQCRMGPDIKFKWRGTGL